MSLFHSKQMLERLFEFQLEYSILEKNEALFQLSQVVFNFPDLTSEEREYLHRHPTYEWLQPEIFPLILAIFNKRLTA